MKTIKAVYKMQGDMLVYYNDGTKKKLDELTESELHKADAFCTTHHIHTDGNIIEYAGAIQPLHSVMVCKKPYSYTAITIHGTTYVLTIKSPMELLQRCEDYISTCKVERKYSDNVIKYSGGEGGI